MDRFTFKELIECTNGTTEYAGEDFEISELSFDTRGDVRGKVFIAFATEKNNGHRYVPVAECKGAAAAIVSENVAVNIPCVKVADTVKAYQDIAGYYRRKFEIPVVALTGSNGKTSVKDMLWAVLSAKYKVLATDKNLNNELGVPQTLLRLDGGCQAAVIELGMRHKGEISTLSKIAAPTLALVTNIGTAHMGNLGGSRRDVFNVKMEISDGLKLGGKLILCGDDDMLSKVSSSEHEIIFSGLENDERNLLYATDIKELEKSDGFGLSFFVCFNGVKYECILPAVGMHNVQNALLALTAGVQLGVPIEDGIKSLRTYPRSSMRLENSSIAGVNFIKDYYNTSSDSLKAALDVLGGANGKRIAVLGEITELGAASSEIHREIAEYSLKRADRVFFLGKSEAAAAAFLSARSDAIFFKTKEELNAALASAVTDGDIGGTVLIKGSNEMKMSEQYEFLRKFLERGSAVCSQTRLLVDVDALKHNYIAIKQAVGGSVQVMPVIKADAYSTGADLLENIYSDCNFFGVADLSEVDELHTTMQAARFLVLYQPLSSEADWIAERGDYVVTAVGDVDFVRALNSAAKRAKKKLAVHIEVDTGMGRLGVRPENCAALAQTIFNCKNIITEGIFTHYSSADMYAPEDLAYTETQTELFKETIKTAEKILGGIKYKHACAGAAIFNPKAELFNMVRPGYILRGYYPCDEIKGKVTIKPALKYVTQVTQVKKFGVGESVSYGRKFVTKRETLIAEIPVGYSDGVMRRLSNKGAFVLHGQLAPIIGNVTMDYTMADVTDISPQVAVGDEVAIFDNVNMTIERMAELCGTIGYEILTNIKDKADKIEVF